MQIELNRKSRHTLSKQLYEGLRRCILAGELKPGEQIPSTRALSQQLRIARATAVAAYDRLKSEGYIQPQDGSATFVSTDLPKHSLIKVDALEQQAKPTARKARLSQYGRRVADAERIQYTWDEPEISFYPWRGAFNAVPLKQLAQAFSRCCRRQDPHLLDYPRDPLGYPPLREAIARTLHRTRGMRVSPDQILIVAGWRQAANLVARMHVERGDLVAVENPCHPGIRQLFANEGAELLPVAVDKEGMQVEELTSADQSVRVVYVCPSHQLPLGSSMSLLRRMELLTWAARTGAIIVEDEHDSEFHYETNPSPPLMVLDEGRQTIFVGTFYKSLFPSLSLAYMVLPEQLVGAYVNARDFSSEHVPVLLQAALADFIKRGLLRRHVRRMAIIYKLRRNALLKALHTHFPEAAIAGENGGLHLLVRFKTRRSSAQLVNLAREAGVGLVSTESFYQGAAPHGEFILGYADLTERKIHEGVRRLSGVLH